MIYLKLEKSIYDKIKKLLPDICPNVQFSLVMADNNLMRLGFSCEIPCVAAFQLDENGFDQMLDDLMQLEIDAFNTPCGEPAPNDSVYQKYLKYGWMWQVLYNAEKCDITA